MTHTTQRTALITGASRGLGFALASELAARGWRLVVDARDSAALAATRQELARHGNSVAIAGDVNDRAHRVVLAGAVEDLGGLDALVNNAGALGPSPLPSLLTYPLQALEELFRTNVVAPLALVQELQALIRPGGRIINITSDAAVEPYQGWGGYGSSKAALEQWSRVLAAENPRWSVYWVDPGDMRTEMQQRAFPGEDISDRPLPEASVPGLVRLLEETLPSGRYRARDLGSLSSPSASAGVR